MIYKLSPKEYFDVITRTGGIARIPDLLSGEIQTLTTESEMLSVENDIAIYQFIPKRRPYEVGEFCLHDGSIWKCIQGYSGNSWDASKFAEVCSLSSSILPYSENPEMDGEASSGTSDRYARGDHVHPIDTSRAALSDFNSHVENKSNPHSVTGKQVGILNDDNEIISNLVVTESIKDGTITKAKLSSDVISILDDVANKADKVSNAVSGNFAGLDENGNLTDSGFNESDFIEIIETLPWEDLKDRCSNSDLKVGQQYCISDYIATTNGNSHSTAIQDAQFDIIVTATSKNGLNETAFAVRHSDNGYFPSDTNFNAWKIWYCLSNDVDRFDWASENGKGVVYRLIDEFGNEAPYDFKGLKFIPYPSVSGENYYFTFDYENGADASLSGNLLNIFNNTVKEYRSNGKLLLPRIVLIGSDNHDNSFGTSCKDITLGVSCQNNTFGSSCNGIIFGDGESIKGGYRCITIENGVEYVNLNCSESRLSNEFYQNVTLKSGICGDVSEPRTIDDSHFSQNFHTTYQPANSLVVGIAVGPSQKWTPAENGSVATEGELNTDGTFDVDGELNNDGTMSVEV